MEHIKQIVYGSLLTLLLSSTSYADCTYELFNISSTKNTKIIDFVEQLSDECEFSIIVTDSHSQEFLEKQLNKTHLKNLTIDEVLSIILKENNLSYTLENNILKISYLSTKIFGIDYILSQRKGSGSTNIMLSSGGISASGGASEGANTGSATTESGIKIESTDEVLFWEELDKELQSIINRPQDTYIAGAPIINKNAGLITVTATIKQMSRLENYLKRLQDKVQLQVLIDVQLLSVTMEEGESTGIDWQQLYALQNFELGLNNLDYKNVSEYEENTITEALYADLKDTAQLVNIKAKGTLNEVIKFLRTQGDVVSISNPKVLTLNNQPALITAGTEYFYKVTSTTNQQGSGGGVAASTQNDTVQSVFAGVLLDITPEIADDKTITLKINPSLSETRSDISLENASTRTMPPDLNRRQLSSVITVKDGGRVILGGLINTRNTITANKVPLLGDIPGINYLFRYEDMTKHIQELVIIIEPHIIDKDNSNISLADLGYKGISDQGVILEKNNKKQTDEASVNKDTKEADEI